MELPLSTSSPFTSANDGRVQDHWAFVTDDTRRVFEIVNHVILTGAICVFGISTNVVNMVVFCKQGLNNTINISLLGLAISDLCSLLFLGWTTVCLNPFMEKADLPFVPWEVEYLTGGGPHTIFARISCWITMYITAERCLCITLPLKVKQIVSPGKARFVVWCIYFPMMLSATPEYATVFLAWKFYPQLNTTLVGLVFTENRTMFRGFIFIQGAALGMVSCFTVVILTCLLAVNLKRKTEWRNTVTLQKRQSDAMSTKDKKTVIMVILIAGILIICFTPSVTLQFVVFIQPVFGFTGIYSNLFHVTWSFAFLFEAINASVTIYLYYTMSSKYRQTFRELFAIVLRK